jgi:hypothetical protein
MLRGPRLDAPGVLHHVMARGAEEAKRRDSFCSLAFDYNPFRHYHPCHVVNPTS